MGRCCSRLPKKGHLLGWWHPGDDAVTLRRRMRPRRPSATLPAEFVPQLASAVKTAPDGDEWLHEIKFDGYRLQLRVAKGKASLKTRKGLDWTARFKALAGAAAHLPDALIDIIRRSLQGETFVAASQAFEVVRSRAHGHVQAVALAMQRLGLASVIASTPSRERDLVLARLLLKEILMPDRQDRSQELSHLMGSIYAGFGQLVTAAQHSGTVSTRFDPVLTAQSLFAIYYLGLLSWLGGITSRDAFFVQLRRQLAMLLDCE